VFHSVRVHTHISSFAKDHQNAEENKPLSNMVTTMYETKNPLRFCSGEKKKRHSGDYIDGTRGGEYCLEMAVN